MPLDGGVHPHVCDDFQEAQLLAWLKNNITAPYQVTLIRCAPGGNFQRILERTDTLRRQGFTTVLVTSLDRICRGPEVYNIVRSAAAAGIQIIVTEHNGVPKLQ